MEQVWTIVNESRTAAGLPTAAGRKQNAYDPIT